MMPTSHRQRGEVRSSSSVLADSNDNPSWLCPRPH